MAITLTDLTLAERAKLGPGAEVVLPDGETHRLGNVTSDQAADTGEWLKIAAYSHTRAEQIQRSGLEHQGPDPWLNLMTGEPLHGDWWADRD